MIYQFSRILTKQVVNCRRRPGKIKEIQLVLNTKYYHIENHYIQWLIYFFSYSSTYLPYLRLRTLPLFPSPFKLSMVSKNSARSKKTYYNPKCFIEPAIFNLVFITIETNTLRIAALEVPRATVTHSLSQFSTTFNQLL